MLTSDLKAFPESFPGDGRNTLRIPLKLHAHRLRFERSDTRRELDVSAPLPEHFARALDAFGIAWADEGGLGM
jgi:hypothetical protein